MNQVEAMAGQAVWAAKNIAYNLDYIPADKLDWKPAPTANSALEIVHHLVVVLKSGKSALETGDFQSADSPAPTNAEEAKQALVSAAEEYAQALRAVKPEDWNKSINLRFGTRPLSFVASMPVVDLLHHHGQIAYIQTLLGDTEPHFDMSLFG